MIRKIIFFIGSIVIAGNCFSQTKFKNKYIDLLNPGSKLIKSGYNYTLEELKSGEFIFKRYYPETRQITHLITFSNKKLDERDGPYEERYDDGTVLHKGNYQNNLKEGRWLENVTEEGDYHEGQRIGKWTRVDSNNRKIWESNYNNGLLDGKVTHYDTTGAINYQELFELGERISETRDSTSPETFPFFPGCEEQNGLNQKECSDKKLLEYIYSNIKYPKNSRNVGAEGEALISFVIEKDGTISSIEPLRSVTEEIGQECMRIVQEMPRWLPGTVNGEPVRVKFNLPVKFKLE